ncbi:MAG: cytochrome P450 [Anaerolineae bacterium]|nr:cytochrome P450 [Anaerolineae bacterium]
MSRIPLPTASTSRNALKALLKRKTVLAALEVFHAELGDVFQIPLPGFNPIMLAGSEANRFVLVEQRDTLRWRLEQDPIVRLLRHGVLVEDGDSHDNLRRQMNPALHRTKLQDYVRHMCDCTNFVLAQWDSSSPLNISLEIRRMALLVLTKTLFGVDFEPEMNRLWQPILRTLRYISPGLWVIWPNIPRPGYQKAFRQLDEYFHRLIAYRRANSTGREDLLSLLIASGMSDDLIRDQLLTMIIAGHDTSTALLSWTLYLLSRHLDIQVEAQAEVDRVLGSNPPHYSSLSELHYLDQIINETLRLYPPIHAGLRIAATDIEFGEYFIPKGTRVMYSIYLSHRDARYWPEPNVFRPERFASATRPPYVFLPFGGGPRNCIGMAFAQVEAKVVLARILQKFDLHFTGKPVRPYMGATLEPRPAVWLNIKERV